MKEIRNILRLYDRLKSEGTTCALATVVSVTGSSYRRIGARLLVGADGRYAGGISGGCLEGDAMRRAKQAIDVGRPSVRVYDTLDGDDREIGMGLGCNGRIEILFVPLDFVDPDNQVEVLRKHVDTRRPVILTQIISAPPGEVVDGRLEELPSDTVELPGGRSFVQTSTAEGKTYVRLYERLRPDIRLLLVGNSYDILPTVNAADQLDWYVEVIGARRKFTTELATQVHRLHDYAEAASISVDEYTAVVCMSHDFERDLQMLRYFLPQSPPYLGVLGPKKRTRKLHAALHKDDFMLLEYPNLHAPVGLDIGAETPEEIAAALVAEVISVFRGRDGRMLKDREGTIHARPPAPVGRPPMNV